MLPVVAGAEGGMNSHAGEEADGARNCVHPVAVARRQDRAAGTCLAQTWYAAVADTAVVGAVAAGETGGSAERNPLRPLRARIPPVDDWYGG